MEGAKSSRTVEVPCAIGLCKNSGAPYGGRRFFDNARPFPHNAYELGRDRTRMKGITFLLLTLWLADVASAADSSQRILARYQALRPAAKDLGMYRLDWADSLDVALKRAAKEKRPVCLIIIHAKYGDISSGHC